MTLKQKIVEDFINSEKLNFTAYNTYSIEIGEMYDKLVASIKRGESFEKFLVFENAMAPNGAVKMDRINTYFDDKEKKTITRQVIFKYPVYNYLKDRYTTAMEEMKQKNKEVPLPKEPAKTKESIW